MSLTKCALNGPVDVTPGTASYQGNDANSITTPFPPSARASSPANIRSQFRPTSISIPLPLGRSDSRRCDMGPRKTRKNAELGVLCSCIVLNTEDALTMDDPGDQLLYRDEAFRIRGAVFEVYLSGH